MKTNKNGVKLLATVMVLAMAVCAFAVITAPASDATISNGNVPDAEDIVSPLGTNTVSYLVKDDVTVDVGSGAGTIAIYLVDKVTLTLTATETNTKTITIYAVSADGKKMFSTDTNISINSLTSGDISIKAAYSNSLKVSSSFTVSGKPTVSSMDIIIGVGDPDNGTVSVGVDGLTLTGATVVIDNLSYGSAFISKDIANTEKIEYSAPGSNKSFTLTPNNDTDTSNIVKILNGTYTVTDGTNTIKFSKFSAKQIAAPVVMTGISTATAATTISGGDVEDSGLITILSGSIKNSSCDSITSKVFTGAESSSNLINKITAVGTYTVYGNYEQNKSITEEIASISVADGSTMIIPENISIKVNTFTLTAGDEKTVVKIFGKLEANVTTGANDAVQVGPYGTYTGSNATGNTNVKSGVDNGRNGDISDVTGDFILTGDSYVPAGKTLVITGNLGINGQKLYVDGKLIIAEGAVVYTLKTIDNIILGKTGSIENNGVFGTIKAVKVSDNTDTDTFTFRGVDGIEFGYTTINGSEVISMTGEVTTNGLEKDGNGKAIGNVTLAGNAAIGKNLTIGSGVTLSGSNSVEIAAGATVVIDGTLNVNVKVGIGASLDINGELKAEKIISAYSGPVDGTGATTGTLFTIVADDNTGSPGYTKGITGFTVYSVKTTVDGKQVVEVFLDGSISEITERTETNAIVAGEFHVSESGLTISEYVTLSASTAKVCLHGILQASADITFNDYVGASYSIKDESGTTPVTTYYYSTLATAIEKIDVAQNKTVTAKIIDLDDIITVSAGQKLDITITGEIKKGASIIVEKDSKTNTINVEGVLTGSIVIYKGVNCIPTFDDDADAIIVSDEKTVYAGFVTAVDMASAGDTLTVGNVECKESLTVKDGVSIIADVISIKGNLTIPETSSLKATTITMVAPADGTKSKINVAGTLDLSEGSISGTYELKSTGKTILTSVNDSMSGAYYTTASGLILTTVSNAVEDATDGEIVIIGKISEKTDITLNGIDLRISPTEGTEVTLGTITLDGAKVIAQNKLTATIISVAETETTGAADASVSITGAVITVQDIETGLQINNVAGKVNVQSGIVAIAGAASVAANSELAVAEGAQALVTGSLTSNLNTAKITIDGELAVKGTLSITNIVPTVNGTITAQAGSTVSISGAKVVGELVADEASAFNITDSKVSVAEGGKIVGEFTLTATMYVKAFAGADVSAMEFAGDVDNTAFYVNNDLIETLYFDSTVDFDTNLKTVVYNDLKNIPEIDLGAATAATLVWKDSDGVQVTTGSINDVSALYVKVDLATADVKVSIGTGISLWIDGIKQVTADTAKLTIGEHQVQVTINPGYKGTATIAFNGATVSNGKIVITADMVGAVNVITATGDITIDSGDTPAPVEPTEKDDGMGITDYLLIVLVVLAAVLVVIVAIRMMRS